MEKSCPSQNKNFLQTSYDQVYAEERAGIPALNLHRWPRNRYEAIIRVVPSRTERLLEIGCGNGTILHHIADRCGEATGLELSENRCRIAARNLADTGKSIEIIHGSIEQGINKPDGYYTTIIWADVIEHVVDLFQVMREVTRLLADNGIVITSTPNVAYLRRRFQLLFGYFPSTAAPNQGFGTRPGAMYDEGHLHYFTVGTLKMLYQQYGLIPEQTLGYGRLGIVHRLWPSLLSGAAFVVGRKVAQPPNPNLIICSQWQQKRIIFHAMLNSRSEA